MGVGRFCPSEMLNCNFLGNRLIQGGEIVPYACLVSGGAFQSFTPCSSDCVFSFEKGCFKVAADGVGYSGGKTVHGGALGKGSTVRMVGFAGDMGRSPYVVPVIGDG
jgi:hypothetical protein